MSQLHIRRVWRRIIIILVIVFIAVLTTIVINPMSTHLDIESLDKKITITDLVTLGALVATLIAGAFSFYFKTEQNNLLKLQRNEDQLAIAKSQAESRDALAKAEIAHVEQKKIEQQNIKLSLDLEKQKMEYLELYTAIAPRIINPQKFAKKLIERKNVTVDLLSVSHPEAQELALSLEKAFRIAGWRIVNKRLNTFRQIHTNAGDIREEGVVIQSADSNLLAIIKKLMEEYRIDCIIKPESGLDVMLEVFVAAKPTRSPAKK